MNIILGKKAGFCGGVINSVNKSNELLDKYNDLYCLGEIVHNKQVVQSLEDKGMTFVESLSVQAIVAASARCDVIVTRNVKDFEGIKAQNPTLPAVVNPSGLLSAR